MGNMTVEQIYKDRLKFSEAVFDVASSSLVAMGVTVISYTIKSLSDEHGYLEALGMTRTAQVRTWQGLSLLRFSVRCVLLGTEGLEKASGI